MKKDIRVLIVEDDAYARDLMALLLTRDWRTQVIGEVGQKEELGDFINHHQGPVDLIILDTENPRGPNWPFDITDQLKGLPKSPAILYTATRADADILHRLSRIGFGGYVRDPFWSGHSCKAGLHRKNCRHPRCTAGCAKAGTCTWDDCS